jgi:hypothetical protein
MADRFSPKTTRLVLISHKACFTKEGTWAVKNSLRWLSESFVAWQTRHNVVRLLASSVPQRLFRLTWWVCG